MTLELFIILFLLIILVSAYEVYDQIPYDEEFKQLKNKNYEHKSTD